MATSTERLHFKIGLSANYWAKIPKYSIIVNDLSIFTKKEIVSPPNTIEYIEFDAEINEGPSSLQIRLENKNWTDTIQNDTGTEILRDMVLTIESIEIDEIELGNLIYTAGIFFPNNATPGMTAKQELIAYYNRGIAYLELGTFEKSLDSFHQAIKLGANFAEVYNYSGDVLTQLGRLDDAKESYSHALTLPANVVLVNDSNDSDEIADAGEINTLAVELDRCHTLGWNGTWKLEFASPFYIWLLEHI